MMRLPYALGAAILTNILEYLIVRDNFKVGSLILSGLTNHYLSVAFKLVMLCLFMLTFLDFAQQKLSKAL